MSRLTYQKFIDIINDFAWSNKNKDITGDVMCQFIVNILHSTAEMKLLDGRTIEQAIAELKNTASIGNGTSIVFSDQFKIEDNTVSLNLKYITANSEEEEETEPPSGYPNFIEKESNPYVTGWEAKTFMLINYDTTSGIDSIAVLKDWPILEGLLGSLGMAVPAAFNFSVDKIATFNASTGTYGYLQFQFKGNEAVKIHGTPIDIGVYIETSRGGYPMYIRSFHDEEWHSATFRWLVINESQLLSIDLLLGTWQVTIPHGIQTGCVFEFKNIKIYKDLA